MKRIPGIEIVLKGATVAVAMALVGGMPAAAQTVIDFEAPYYVSGPLQDQDTWTVAKTNEVVLTATELAENLTQAGLVAGTTVHGGNQAMLASQAGSGGASVRPIEGYTAARMVSLTAWARPLTPRTDGAVNLGNIFLTMEDWGNVRAAAFRFGYDAPTGKAHIDWATDSTALWQDSGVAWTSNTWYQITMTVNYAAKTYDFAVNGTKINAEPIPFYGGNSSENLYQIRVYRGSNQAGMILDDITVTDVTPVGPFLGVLEGTAFGWSFDIWDAFDGATPDISTIAVKVDGVTVVPTRITQSGNIGSGDGTGVTTVAYESTTPIYLSGSTHLVDVDFGGSGFPPVHASLEFTVPMAEGAFDRVQGYVARFQGKAAYGGRGSGHTGVAGDYAVDIGTPARQNNNLVVTDGGFLARLNDAAAADTVTMSFWVRHRQTASTSVFWAYSSKAPDNRGMQLHCPYYSNQDAAVFFDSGGTAAENRVSAMMTTFPAYDGLDTWWNVWHHVVAVKSGAVKQVWIDGELLLSASDQAALFADITRLYLGCGISGGAPALSIDGWLDDVAVYATALDQAAVAALHQGTAPDQVPAAASLLAWWDFNDAPDLSFEGQGDQLVVTFTHVLQTSPSILGPFVDRFDLKSPYTHNPASGPRMFFRTRK
ncbi:MAG TPA: hypothetical protein PKM73_08980 [Verrucomicrobiota bacterium]|nr:hypothetical protein [Verrucomicrobiota bacterium]HNU51881.1 hypothetical protein [Verrucomicrobiota bacterium]